MKTIIAGSRSIEDYSLVCEAVHTCPFRFQITEVVSGKARGVDTLGERWAKENNLPINLFPADWARFGKSAGWRRNVEMAAYADALVAVWDGVSKGTNNMINIAQKKHLSIWIYKSWVYKG